MKDYGKGICAAEDCGRPAKTAQLCGTPVERFWERVDVMVDGCWTWTGEPTSEGYGKLSINSRPVYAHRFSYVLLVGPILDGLEIDHLCRNRACVRPDHLEAVTHAENIRRGMAAVVVDWRRKPRAEAVAQ